MVSPALTARGAFKHAVLATKARPKAASTRAALPCGRSTGRRRPVRETGRPDGRIYWFDGITRRMPPAR